MKIKSIISDFTYFKLSTRVHYGNKINDNVYLNNFSFCIYSNKFSFEKSVLKLFERKIWINVCPTNATDYGHTDKVSL